MKYLYQQMLAFFAVILTILVIIGISFSNFASSTVYKNTEKQLYGYAQSVIDDGLINQVDLIQVVLKSQNVNMSIFNEEKQMIAPKQEQNYSLNISEKDWKTLQAGNQIASSINNTDFLGNKVEQIRVFQPFFKRDTGKFAGVVAVEAPVSGVESSIKDLKHNLFIALLLSSVGAMFLSFFLAKYQVNRINRMRKATHRISQGDFDVYLENKDRDEFDDLAEDFNGMARSLKASHEEIERQENRRRQFMADAAHEMRTPLTTINGVLEGLEYDMIPENQKKRSIQLMQNETRRLIRLVNENLDYEKIRSNQISLTKQTFNAEEALTVIVEQLKTKANDAGNQLELNCPADLTVYADYDRFVQIIVNILQNAIQFTTDGSIVIKGSKTLTETIIEIQDNGIGMTAQEVENIWERYYKADVSRKNTKYGESGLGLAIVQQLMNLHQANVTVTSEKGVGTTFKLAFPIETTDKKD